MIRIALVGEIASGKTFVAKCFRLPSFNADLEVKKIYKTNKHCFIKLNRKFPNNIKHYPIKKSEIKQILNKSNIKRLSKIVHPYVRFNLKKFERKHSKKKFIVLDIPLLIENKLYKKSDILIGVKTPKKIIIKRLKQRGNYNKKILGILRTQQLDVKRKFKLCDFIIENNSDKNNILKQIKIIKKKLND
tara:strand:+ start:492 stop:1058 length:567 start_codon:yes stop_codon:yes gene_type:complete